MRKLITSFLILISLMTFGQNKQVEDIWKLYKAHDFKTAIEHTEPLLDKDPNNLDLNLALGLCYTEVKKYREAIPFLKFTVKNDNRNSWQKAWAYKELGTCYFMQQEYEASKESINTCLELNATKQSYSESKSISLFCGFNEYYNEWNIVESEHFRFHFQNMSQLQIDKYITSREEAFKNINKFFESELPKKIDFFVWDSREDAKKILGANLGFANSDFCIVHSHYNQTKGHEMTHVISNYSTLMITKTGLINEGTAVYFDLTNQDKEQIVKDWIKNNGKQVEISEIWNNWKNYPEELTYPLSGIFIKELIDNFGKEKFIKFFGNQTYDNAKLIFGEKLEKVIKDFENKINT